MMARVVKAAEVRRAEILDVAQKLFIELGYEATSVNAILDELGLSKGAFYHHFESKEEVLQALAVRWAEQVYAVYEPIVCDRKLSPLEKLNALFRVGTQFKKENLPLVRAFAPIYVREENLRLRTRLVAETTAVVAPLFARVFEEGKRDGSFQIEDPEETARVILHMSRYLQDVFAAAWKRAETDLAGAAAQFTRSGEAYERALEGILGLARHSISIADPKVLKLFLQREKKRP